VLIVEDDENISELVAHILKKEGYEVTTVTTGEDALLELKIRTPELVVLDLMLPGLDGFSVCKTIKTNPETKNISVVMLTAKGEEADIVTGLELGADDYITKPFGTKVLKARIKAVLRRRATVATSSKRTLKIASMYIDPERHEAFLEEKKLELTATEFRLLYLLADHAGRVFTRSHIVEGVHGNDYPVTERSVDVQMVGLRKKLGNKADDYIETVRGVGYRFRDIY
jgi:two-component system phosphate regulon response regulator PhoB